MKLAGDLVREFLVLSAWPYQGLRFMVPGFMFPVRVVGPGGALGSVDRSVKLSTL